MAGRRALVVDDSKSARAFLTRILETYALEVDSAESAEQAIEYLTRHRPDVIFMDHLMPGMDGFQAVQTIKNNPRTATIPIMMYTSQEGELYLGQARALGAIGVMPKQIRPADVSKVLYELHLIEDRRSENRVTFPVAGAEAERDISATTTISPAATTAAMHSALTLTTNGETLLRDQIAEVRRFVASSLDAQSERVVDEVRMMLQDLPVPVIPPPFPPQVDRRGFGLAAAALAGLLIVTALWMYETTERRALASRLDRLVAAAQQRIETQPEPATLEPGFASVEALTSPPAPAPARTPPTQTSRPARPAVAPVAASVAPATIVEVVPFGEAPLSGTRVERVRNILRRLAEQGFRGAVDVETFAGRFCLIGNASEGYTLAPAETALSDCALVGNPPGESRESLPFANMISEMRNNSGIAVRVGSGSPEAIVAAYPASGTQVTAAQWNAVAAANNRIEIRWHPQT
ncbi:MAG: response regulator [Steroidobacteraceae bacterium]